MTVQLLIMNSHLVIITLYDSTEADNFPEEFLCTSDQVIHSLDSSQATGADGISTRMLKATASSTSKSLSDLFNKSIITGMLPTDWKIAKVFPIPKSGCSKDPANYRSISILTIISKLLEKHIHNLLLQYLNSVSPLSQHQYGFTAEKFNYYSLTLLHPQLSSCP